MDADGLDFLWLELTNRCNLRCVHCYTDSHPGSGDRDLLTTGAYESLLRQAYELGCRRVQFIGGEPPLHPDLLRLLGTAKRPASSSSKCSPTSPGCARTR
jgi:molybdenum cofactor biosynthesis enzyme MoaA